MVLDPVSAEHLKHLGTDCEVVDEDGFTWVVLKRQRLPEGYSQTSDVLIRLPDARHKATPWLQVACETADVLIKLPDGFPDAEPDMFWIDPILTLEDGRICPPGAEVNEQYLDRVWQRWSRHIRGHWRPGIDTIRSYVAYIHRCLAETAAGAAK